MTSPAELSESGQRAIPVEGRFRVLADIGEGGMSYVQLAVARGPSGFHKLVVLKTLRESLAKDPEVAASFRREARLAARLNHPNVVQTYEVNEEGSRQFMVLEYLEGQALSRIIKSAHETQQRFPRGHHLRVLCDALSGLHYAHEVTDFGGKRLGLVHRDISPHNVFVTYEGQVKVLDFGIAKVVSQASEHVAESDAGIVKGKLRYMSPEQMSGDDIDRRADIFSVGVMLWEALTGEKIWANMADVQVMNRVAGGKFPSIRERVPDVPDELERICVKAMSFSPADRYATAAEFQTELENALQTLREDVRSREVGRVVGEMFADTRDEMKRVIESQLRGTAMKSMPPPVSETLTSQSNSMLRKARPPTPKSNGLLFMGIAVVGFATAGYLVYSHRAANVPVNGASAATVVVNNAAPSTPAVPPSASEVNLRVLVTPVEAHMFLDDKELPSNPYDGMIRRDRERHVLRVEATGYVTKTLDVSLDKPSTMSLALDREGEKGKAPPSGGGASYVPRPKPSAAPAPTAAAGTRPSICAQPFYVDEQGIKRLRPACM